MMSCVDIETGYRHQGQFIENRPDVRPQVAPTHAPPSKRDSNPISSPSHRGTPQKPAIAAIAAEQAVDHGHGTKYPPSYSAFTPLSRVRHFAPLGREPQAPRAFSRAATADYSSDFTGRILK